MKCICIICSGEGDTDYCGYCKNCFDNGCVNEDDRYEY